MRKLDPTVFQTLRLLRPYDVELCKERVGGERDGGYVLACLPGTGDILSIGIDNNIDFDLEMAGRGRVIHMFDHTVGGPPIAHDGFRFHQLGVCGATGLSPVLITIDQMIELSGFGEQSILKIDVEGAEWDVFSTISQRALSYFDQIAVEIHWLENLEQPDFNARVAEALNRINSQFTLFHVHGNNNTDVHIVGGLPVVSVLELSYVRTSKIRRTPSTQIYPAWPNRANRQDYCDLPLLFYPFLPITDVDGAIDAMIAQVASDWKPTHG